jgi:hypothetical protein
MNEKLTAAKVRSNTILPYGADYMLQSNQDSNGNFQTIVYKRGGASGVLLKTISIVYDSDSNVLSVTES